MDKYSIIIETNSGQFFEEIFEEVSGRGIAERINEINVEGFKSKSTSGTIAVLPNNIKVVRQERQ